MSLSGLYFRSIFDRLVKHRIRKEESTAIPASVTPVTSSAVLAWHLYIQTALLPSRLVCHAIAEARSNEAVPFAYCRVTLTRLGARTAKSIRQTRESRAQCSVTFEKAA
jgi:hypothetical protein